MNNIKMLIKGLLSFLFFASAAVSCKPYEVIKGNGEIITESIDISDYNEVNISGSSVIINYIVSDSFPALMVTVDRNIYDIYTIETNGNELIIRPQKEYRFAQIRPTEFFITTNSRMLDKVSLSGSVNFNLNSIFKGESLHFNFAGDGNINLNDSIYADKLSVNIAGKAEFNSQYTNVGEFNSNTAGMGTINIKGNAGNASYKIAGAGTVSAFDFVTEELSCRIAGKGTADINVTKRLNVNVAGMGDVTYKGSPTNIVKVVAGKGNVKAVED